MAGLLTPRLINSSPGSTAYPTLWRYDYFNIQPLGSTLYQEQVITGIVDISAVRGDPSGDYGAGVELHFNDIASIRHFQCNFRIAWHADGYYVVRQTVTSMNGPESDTANVLLPAECDYLFFAILVYRSGANTGISMVVSPSFQLTYDSVTSVNKVKARLNSNKIDEVVVKGYCCASDTGMSIILDPPILREESHVSTEPELGEWYHHPPHRDDEDWSHKDPTAAYNCSSSWPYYTVELLGYSFSASKIVGTIEMTSTLVNTNLGDPGDDDGVTAWNDLNLFQKIKRIWSYITDDLFPLLGAVGDLVQDIFDGDGIDWSTHITSILSAFFEKGLIFSLFSDIFNNLEGKGDISYFEKLIKWLLEVLTIESLIQEVFGWLDNLFGV